ncbi:MAG: DNA polymerase III subunit delta, partial [Bacteroidota bacterium]|nr:DNA polymerase III subunit delta [Bacteroidota bacterium]
FHHTVAPRFLKSLEEPPDKTLFLLISEAQDKMISTIISRTQIVKIPRLDDQSLFEILINKTGSAEKEVRDAVAVANGNYVVAHRFLIEADTNDVNMNLFRDWMRLCYSKEIINIEKFVSKIAGKGREELKSFFLYALRVVRSEMLIYYQNEALVRSSKEEEEFLYKFSPYMNAANIRQFTEAFDKAYYYIERNANPSITFMDLSLKAIRLLKLKPAEKVG